MVNTTTRFLTQIVIANIFGGISDFCLRCKFYPQAKQVVMMLYFPHTFIVIINHLYYVAPK